MAEGVRGFFAALPLVAASVAFSLATAEACLRMFPQLMPEEFQLRLHWRDTSEPVSEADPYLGYVFPPNHVDRIERSDGGFAFNYSTDEHGFRNPSPWRKRADIVVLGDSMAFGYGVDDDETWTALLADQLPGSRIINLGLPGAAPQQYLRFYEKFGRTLQPALILFCLFPGNDVGDAGRFDRWVKAGSQGNYLLRRYDDGNDESPRSIRHMLSQSYLVQFLRYTRNNAVSQITARTIDFPDGGQIQLVPAFDDDVERQTRPDHPNFRLVLDTVERTHALAERSGSGFLVLLFPTKQEVYLPLVGDEERPPAITPFVSEFDAGGNPIPGSHAASSSLRAAGRTPVLQDRWPSQRGRLSPDRGRGPRPPA